MFRPLMIAAAGLMLGGATLSPSTAQSISQEMPMRGMMGGGCPMMGMMGQGMMDGGMRGRGMMGQGMMRGKGMMRGSRMGAMTAGRLAYLKAELSITDAQEPVWKEYSDAAKERVSIMQGMRQSMMKSMQSGTAIERMEARISGMEAMLDAMKAVKPAADKLYATLADEQKKIADDLIGVDCGAM